MASTPQQSLPDDFASGVMCAICGARALRVAHLKSFPDYVICGSCKASFVAEADGERVLYGKIPEAYPQARAVALRKWVTLDDVEGVARRERPAAPPAPRFAAVPIPAEPEIDREASLRAAASAAVPIPTQPEIERPPIRSVPLEFEDEVEDEEPAALEEEDEDLAAAEPEVPLGRLSRLMAGAPESEPLVDWAPSLVPDRMPAEAPIIPPTPSAPAPQPSSGAPKPVATAAPAPVSAAAKPASAPPPSDPPPGQRHRVIVRGDQVVFPMQACAHCMQSPAPNRLTIIGSAVQGQGVGQRQVRRYNVPLCRACYRRATAQTAEGNSARLNAHLISALVALGLLVAALAVGLIDPARVGVGPAVVFVLILIVVGYAAPAVLLLGRAGRFPPTDDARYVRTTLLIPEESQGLETAYEWRNGRYAEQFYQANRERALAGVVAIKDRTRTG